MIQIGLKCKLFRGPAGTDASTLVKNATDVTFSISTAEADITTRGSDWRLTVATLKEGELSFSILYDTADADYIAFQQAFLSNTAIGLLVGDENGNGPAFDASITKFDLDQSLEQAVKVNVTAKPTVVGGASPVYPHWVGGSSSN